MFYELYSIKRLYIYISYLKKKKKKNWWRGCLCYFATPNSFHPWKWWAVVEQVDYVQVTHFWPYESRPILSLSGNKRCFTEVITVVLLSYLISWFQWHLSILSLSHTHADTHAVLCMSCLHQYRHPTITQHSYLILCWSVISPNPVRHF